MWSTTSECGGGVKTNVGATHPAARRHAAATTTARDNAPPPRGSTSTAAAVTTDGSSPRHRCQRARAPPSTPRARALLCARCEPRGPEIAVPGRNEELRRNGAGLTRSDQSSRQQHTNIKGDTPVRPSQRPRVVRARRRRRPVRRWSDQPCGCRGAPDARSRSGTPAAAAAALSLPPASVTRDVSGGATPTPAGGRRQRAHARPVVAGAAAPALWRTGAGRGGRGARHRGHGWRPQHKGHGRRRVTSRWRRREHRSEGSGGASRETRSAGVRPTKGRFHRPP